MQYANYIYIDSETNFFMILNLWLHNQVSKVILMMTQGYASCWHFTHIGTTAQAYAANFNGEQVSASNGD